MTGWLDRPDGTRHHTIDIRGKTFDEIITIAAGVLDEAIEHCLEADQIAMIDLGIDDEAIARELQRIREAALVDKQKYLERARVLMLD